MLYRLASLQLKVQMQARAQSVGHDHGHDVNTETVTTTLNGTASPIRGLGTILFVVPFVALAEEKAAYFQHMWQDMHIGVQSFHGDDEGNIYLLKGPIVRTCSIFAVLMSSTIIYNIVYIILACDKHTTQVAP